MKEMAKRIHIVHMNDLHSRFENMPKIATYIKELRETAAEKNEPVIVVDLGDHMDRMRVETEGTYGKVNVEILNETGVLFATLGNNEGLTFTKGLLTEAYHERQFKLLVCNLTDLKTGEIPPWAIPYTIEEIGGLKIGWIGATAPYETFYRLQDWKVEKPIPLIREIVEQIQADVDLIVVLSHLGIKDDEELAREIPEIDLILGGHTHRFLEGGLQVGSTLICQVGIFGESIGHVTIDYPETPSTKWHPHEIELDLREKTVQVASYKDDSGILAILDKNRIIAKTELSHTIVTLKQSLGISLDSESPLGNLMADGVRRRVHAEIGLVNTGQILEGLTKGNVTKARIHEICPSPINACTLPLTGKQIRQLLEESLLQEKIHLPLKGYGFRGKELGTLAVSGLVVEYNPTEQDFHRIKKITYHNEPLLDEKKYLVGTLDMFTFGGGYKTIKESINNEQDIQYFLPEFLRDILSEQLQNQQWIDESFQTRWIKESKESIQ